MCVWYIHTHYVKRQTVYEYECLIQTDNKINVVFILTCVPSYLYTQVEGSLQFTPCTCTCTPTLLPVVPVLPVRLIVPVPVLFCSTPSTSTFYQWSTSTSTNREL